MGQERRTQACLSSSYSKIYKEPGILLTCHPGQETQIKIQMGRCPKLIDRFTKKEHLFLFLVWFPGLQSTYILARFVVN